MSKREANIAVSDADDEGDSEPLTPDRDKAGQNDEALLAVIAKRSYQSEKIAETERQRMDSPLRGEQAKFLAQENATSQKLEKTVEPPATEQPRSTGALDFEDPRECPVKELPKPASQETAEPTRHLAERIRSQPSADEADTRMPLKYIPQQAHMIQIQRPLDSKSLRP